MKTKEEIDELYHKLYTISIDGEDNLHYYSFVEGYSKCEEYMADKKYTEEDLMSAFNAGINNDYGNGPSFDQWLNSLNKQD